MTRQRFRAYTFLVASALLGLALNPVSVNAGSLSIRTSAAMARGSGLNPVAIDPLSEHAESPARGEMGALLDAVGMLIASTPASSGCRHSDIGLAIGVSADGETGAVAPAVRLGCSSGFDNPKRDLDGQVWPSSNEGADCVMPLQLTNVSPLLAPSIQYILPAEPYDWLRIRIGNEIFLGERSGHYFA